MKQTLLALLAPIVACISVVAYADGVFISAAHRTDAVFDAKRQMVYIADGDQVLRYDVAHDVQLEPIPLGGELVGVDLSPDEKTLAVADSQIDSVAQLHMVDLDTLNDQPARASSIGGAHFDSFGVAYVRDGEMVVSSMNDREANSSSLRSVDPDNHTSRFIATILGASVVAASGDGKVVGYAEWGGAWGVYYPQTRHIDSNLFSGDRSPLYEIGVNHDGSQFGMPSYRVGTGFYNRQAQQIAAFGTTFDEPIAVAYAPVDPIAYLPWTGTQQVRVYDMDRTQLLGAFEVGDTFTFPTDSFPFVKGRTRVSRDGSVLLVTVTGGVRLVRMYDPLVADDLVASTTGRRVAITLQGHIGNGGALSYGIQTQPSHGRVFVEGNQATYVPAPGYTGQDSFTYAAHYGLAVANATVTVDVTADPAPYDPLVSFATLPVLQATSAVPSTKRIPGDFNGDKTSDLLWFNPGESKLGYWTMAPNTVINPVRHIGSKTFAVTPGYYVGAVGDFDGDGYADLMFTSGARDLWLWTNSRTGGWRSRQSYGYPGSWQLLGAGDVDGDGKDDLLWLDPSHCQFAYWLMNGAVRKSAKIFNVSCGYYPIGVGYYSPFNRLSILWSSAANDLYVWDARGSGFRTYDLSAAMDLDYLPSGLARSWAIGGGYAGSGIGIEWNAQDQRLAVGGTLTRSFDAQGNQVGYLLDTKWHGGLWMDDPHAAGYLIRGGASPATALYALDVETSTLQSGGLPSGDAQRSGNAPRTLETQWTYPAGWYVVGAPGNQGVPLPWR